MLKTYKVPNTFKNVFDKNTLQYDGTNLKRYNAIDMLNYIGMRSGMEKWKSVPIMSEQLKQRYGKNYKKYISFLTDNYFIVSSNSWTAGEYSIKYRCTPTYYEDDFVDCIVEEKKLNSPKISFNKNTPNLNEYVNLYNDFYRFTIDTDVFSWLYSPENTMSNDQNVHAMATIHSMISNNIHFHIDDHRRLHSNITTLKKYVRHNYLLADGMKTCEVDIKNSQPAILGKLMEADGVKNCAFIKDTKDGIIYEKIMAEGKLPDRKDAKNMTYTAMFGPGNNKNINAIFGKLYPEAYEWLCNKRKEVKNYKMVSHIIQKKEAEFIFDILLPVFRDKYVDYPFATVHDSVITIKTDTNEEEMNKIKNELFLEYK